MEIKEIQEWEKDFYNRKINKKHKPEELMIISFLKLSEEVGELAETILLKNYDEIPAEVADVIIFACKIAKIAEDHYGQTDLTSEIKKKIEYSEERKFDQSIRSFTKPDGGFKRWKGKK